jgi:type II secretory pathway component PulF
MSNTKYFLDRDIEERTDLLVSSIKPVILVFTGFLVGWMAIAVFGPIYSNLGNFSDPAGMVNTKNVSEAS